MNSPSKLLLITVENWEGIARLPKALQTAGFKVAVLCPSISFIAKTLYVDRLFYLNTKEYSEEMLQKIIQVIRDWQPSIIIPGDDWTVGFLQYWVISTLEEQSRILPLDALKLIQFSLGEPKYYKYTISKKKIQEIALEINLRTPPQILVTGIADTLNFVNEYSYPVVLKKEFCSGGHGVRICFNEKKLQEAIDEFQFAHQESSSIILQKYIHGQTAMHSLVAMSGKVLAGLTAIKEQVHPTPTGPSTVVKFITQPEIESTVSILINHLGYTGFASFDFIIEEKTGLAYLLESNPRPTPICHLGEIVGIDLCAALFAAISGRCYSSSKLTKVNTLIALFPQEWRRDLKSIYLQNAYHDVPWDDPALFKAYCKSSCWGG